MNETKKIWIAKYFNHIMPDTLVLAFDENDAKHQALAVYRYHNNIRLGIRKDGPIVKSVKLSKNQKVFSGQLIMPVSEFKPEKPVVKIHTKKDI